MEIVYTKKRQRSYLKKIKENNAIIYQHLQAPDDQMSEFILKDIEILSEMNRVAAEILLERKRMGGVLF